MSVAGTPADAPDRDDAIRAVVTRLSRPGPAGGAVVERAAILAEGADSEAIITWILTHAGQPEAIAPQASTRGLHGGRLSDGLAGRKAPAAPLRPPGQRTDLRPSRRKVTQASGRCGPGD